MSLALPTAAVRPTAGLLRALADENRLRIVVLLGGGELCVCHIAEALGLSQPNASQHLGVLRNAGLVEGERRGGWTHYRLRTGDDPVRDRLLRAVADSLDADAAREDRARLDAAVATPCR